MKILTSHPQWNTVVEVCQKLRSHGHQAVIAGGAVRDALRDVLPKDLDLATSAPAATVLSLFQDAKSVGEHFGVVLIKGHIEVASFRKEGLYTDGRHPEVVESCSIEEDALRRDFTINAMYYDPVEQRLLDFVNGKVDLKRAVIRTVGNPLHRFNEDHLRILRAYRFMAKTGFVLDAETKAAIVLTQKKLLKISNERIQQELLGTLGEPFYFTAFQALCANKTIGVFSDLKFSFNSGLQFYGLNNTCDESCRLAMLLSPTNSLHNIESNLKRLKFSNQFIRNLKAYVKAFATLESTDATEELKLIQLADKQVLDSIKLMQQWVCREEKKLLLDKFNRLVDSQGHLPQPIVDGKFLIEVGLKPGPGFENHIQQAYELQLKGIIRNNLEAQLWVKSNLF